MDYYSIKPVRGRPDGKGGVSVVLIRCVCGWFESFSSYSESPSTCPDCSGDLVIRNQTDTNEIVYPVVTAN